jgi:cytochrome c-type biogenesis protein CcmH
MMTPTMIRPTTPRALSFMMAVLMWGAIGATPVMAVEVNEMLADPVLEARARELGKELRCLVCQNQSIDDSNAGLAKDLRVLVRQRLTAGDSDEQALRYIVDRYGDYVLLRPPVKPATYALWLAPVIFLALGAFAFARLFRGQGRRSNS